MPTIQQTAQVVFDKACTVFLEFEGETDLPVIMHVLPALADVLENLLTIDMAASASGLPAGTQLTEAYDTVSLLAECLRNFDILEAQRYMDQLLPPPFLTDGTVS